VEIDGSDRSFVAVDADLADVPDVSPLASISAAQALEAVAKFCDTPLDAMKKVSAPEINFFMDPEAGRTWHLAYHFTEVPAVPPEAKEETEKLEGCVGPSSRGLATYDFLVDAHTGEIVFSFASHAALADIPVQCTGLDELGVNREFFGRNFGPGFELYDPLRGIKTFDQQFNDISSPNLPVNPCQNATANFGNVTAAVSAHYHAKVVFDFYNSVLKRKSIDDKGMVIMSMVNCTSPQDEPPPNWHNAAWWSGRMWYGQVQSGGKFESFSRYLDVIGHELTHGVTETTSNLVYRNQSGALNESFSDIFGVMINNWYPNEPNSIDSWNWEIGPNLRGGGLPLRDMSNPQRTNHPDHMSKYVNTTRDNGGVHTNSNIHNKAAYNLLTSKDVSGQYVFTPVDVAILYYLTLTRLSRMATFSDCLRTLKSVAAIYYSGDTAVRDARVAAIDTAYAAVGIT
jgi:Zn-dependent metalloprotease